ncbi:MAG: HIT family protein [Candidatus Saccharimonadales bacterium]
MQDSIFTKIIKGEIPCHKIYENDHTFAFLDIYPVQPGHVLVIPKRQVEFVWDLSADDYQALTLTVQKIAKHMRTALGAKYIAQAIVGTDVPHAHVHLYPIQSGSDVRAQPPTEPAPKEELAAMAQKLKMEDYA